MSTPSSVQSNLTPAANASDVERLRFVVRAALSGLRTSMPVQVVGVTNNGGVSPIGYVSVQPMVSGVDGMGNAWPHGTIHNVPYMRIQGGSNAVILDPEEGDIGLASVCDRDISTVKNSGGVSAPGSLRRHDMSDMVYLMTIIGAAPTQYVQFNADGINVVSPGTVTIQASNVDINASTQCAINSPNIILNGPIEQGQGSNAGNASMGGVLTVQTDVKLASGTALSSHTHTSESPGTPTSPPIVGT
jgi:hypothetical protein